MTRRLKILIDLNCAAEDGLRLAAGCGAAAGGINGLPPIERHALEAASEALEQIERRPAR